MNLHERAILIKPSLPVWPDRMPDAEETRAIEEKHGATRGSARVTKRLIPETAYTQRQRDAGEELNAYHALCAHLSAVRIWSYKNTVPWNRDGWLILPRLNYEAYMDHWRKQFAEFERLRGVLEGDWAELADCAKRQLNGLAKGVIWPDVFEVLSRFDMKVTPRPVPDADFRVKLSEAELEILKGAAEADMRDMAQQATAEAAKKLYEHLESLRTRLFAKNGTRKSGYSDFRDTLIENVREVCEILKRLNVMDDPKLEQYRREAELLAMSEPDTLRENVDVRLATAAAAQQIIDDMEAAFGKDALI
jgi:hypothetical protein